jgi:hypothetical protein
MNGNSFDVQFLVSNWFDVVVALRNQVPLSTTNLEGTHIFFKITEIEKKFV